MLEQTGTSRLPRSWYPVACSRDLKPGGHLALSGLGKGWLLFRGEGGWVGVIRRQCPHMGVDLAQGRVRGEAIECPLHGWRFDGQGACVRIPSRDGPCGDIRAGSLHCAERHGLIFVYWGEEPDFELPDPPGMSGRLLASRPYTLILEAPHHVPCLNTFDLQHFERIHQRRFVRPPRIEDEGPWRLRIEYQAEVQGMRWVDHLMNALGSARSAVTIDCWGASLLMMSNRSTGMGAAIGMWPLGEHRSRVFISAIKASAGEGRVHRRVLDRFALWVGVRLVRGFLQPDLIPLTGMIPRRGPLLEGVDDGARRYWDYWDALPRWSGPSGTGV